jgi:dipeptidyl aminopeptidase/acylaminoacyl peptidase
MIRHKVCAAFFLIWLVLTPTHLCSRDSKRAFTVKDSIEATEVLKDPENGTALISPNGKRYVVVLHRGDLGRNGSWVELLSGSTASVKAACNPSVAARLFSRATVRASDLIKNIRWLDDSERITFLWDSGETPSSIVAVNVRTGQTQTLVKHPTPIVAYDISPDGQTIVFVAESRRNPQRESMLARKGFVVTDQPIWSILQGDDDGWTPTEHYETFALSRADALPRRIRDGNSIWSTSPELLQLSPDALHAVAVEPARSVPQKWDAYTEHIFRDDYLPGARRNPGNPGYIRQYFIIDIKRAIARPLWDAPENPPGKVLWSPSSRQLAIGPTFLPVQRATPMGLAGQAVAVVDITSGKFDLLSVPERASRTEYQPVSWSRDGVIQIADAGSQNAGRTRLNFGNLGGKWQSVGADDQTKRSEGGVKIELREGPNSPPKLYAIEGIGKTERLIRDLDPQLRKDVTLGHVELVHWRATDGRSWSGMLYYPVHFESGRSFPLVIQTHGYSVDKFSLDGSFTTVFAAQALANHDIAVLQLGGPDNGIDDVVATPKEPEVFWAGIVGAIQHFAAAGLLDAARVGIIGFSRTGWLVEYALTHSEPTFAAAEVADNIDGSYVQYVLGADEFKAFDESDKGAAPFGNGLGVWFRKAPGFNCEMIHTPLRMELDSGPIDQILGEWEVFSNLRYLGKPVELSVIPDIEHGAHILQNPAQRLSSQGGTVDWFSFWLRGEEDSSPQKASQYARWRQLREVAARGNVQAHEK